ncbi:hypothetical protein AZF04_02745 [Alkalihalobacillus trypoxylicola]|uniref:DUF4340 domain-containing protein n=1 Tax=Alkalihalobacillus trypoxylicola TaxID=519424 RepID=A0A162FCB5_9BACI|nr:hypothetical protein AZF04_02745 [Alkalihalobacillus trypoxylicola]
MFGIKEIKMTEKRRKLVKRKNLMVLILILFITIAAYFMLNVSSSQKEMSHASVHDSTIFELNINEVDSVQLLSSNQELEIENIDGEWTIKGKETEDIDPIKLFEYVHSVTKIPTLRLITDRNDIPLEEYGLNSPDATIKIQTKDDTHSFLLGNKLATGNEYYMMNENNQNIYSIANEVAHSFLLSLEQLSSDYRKTEPNLMFKEIVYEKGDDIIKVVPYPQNTPYVMSQYYLEYPYTTKPELNEISPSFEAIVAAFTSIYPTESFERKEDLSFYHLDQPLLKLTMKAVDEQERVIKIGKERSSGYYYAQFEDDSFIHIVNLAEHMEIFDVTAFDMAVKTPVYTFMTNIKEMQWIVENETYHLQFDSEEMFKLNGKEVAPEKIRDFYLALLELNPDAEVADENGFEWNHLEAQLKIVFDNEEETQIDFYSFNELFLVMVKDGEFDFVITKEKVQQITTFLKSL